MNFAKKTLSFAMAAAMTATSLLSGTTAFAASKNPVYTAMTGPTQAISVNVKDEVKQDESGYKYHDYSNTDGYSYYTYTPSQTGYYAVSISSTPIYRNYVTKTTSYGSTYNTYEYSYVQGKDKNGKDSVRQDNASFYVSENEFDTGYIASGSTYSYVASYAQKDVYSSPEAATYNYYNGYDTVKLTAGKTYYIKTYNDYNYNYVENAQISGERAYFSGATLSIVPTDWYVDSNVTSSTVEFKVNGNTVERTIYTPYYSATYVGSGKDAIVPDALNGIAVKAVTGTENKAITSLTLGANVEKVNGFSGLKSLASVNLASVKEISGSCFSGDTALTAVTIPATVKSVGSSAFSECTSLSSVVLTEGVEEIGSYAFADTALTGVDIPASVTEIGECAFGFDYVLNNNTVYPIDLTYDVKANFAIGSKGNAVAYEYAVKAGIPYVDTTNGCTHYNVTTTVAATLFAKGSTTTVCSICGNTVKKSIKKKTFKLSSVKSSKKKTIVVKAKKQSGITGYQVQYSTSSKFAKKSTKSVKVKTTKALSKTVKGLKSGKKYYVRVRAYSTSGKKTTYSAWTAKKSVKVK